MYRLSRQIFVEIKDAVDPHPDTISAAEARRRVLRACEATIERLARDPRYFPKPARSLFQEIRYYFPITEQARVFYTIERTLAVAGEFIQNEIERSGEGAITPCRATTRKGKPRSEEHTSELQSRQYLVCRLLLEKKKHPFALTRRHQERQS